jgi:hypothetical protein
MDVRGRSHILRRSYPTTRAILTLALAFCKLYMAFTRAGQRLVLSIVGSVPAQLQELEKSGLLNLT